MLDPKYVTFIEVVKSGSFTKAADKLCLTQPAVSNQIKAIENEFEVKIFDRKMRALTLTPEGEILYKYAQRMEMLSVILQKMKKEPATQPVLSLFR